MSGSVTIVAYVAAYLTLAVLCALFFGMFVAQGERADEWEENGVNNRNGRRVTPE